MSLRYILQQIAPDIGINLASTTERALLISRINRAAKELYETKKLFGSLFDDLFDINVGANTVTFPWYVKTILGLRWFDGRYSIDLEDMQSRYANSIDTEIWYLKHRSKDKSPLARNIENQSVLKFKPLGPLAAPVNITITGPTDRSSQWIEMVTIPAGNEDAVSTSGNYADPMKSIRKSAVTTFDIQILDVEDNELGVIPNMLDRTEYNVVQILDSELLETTAYDAVEVLYEKPFIPLVNDEDEFVFGDSFDDAIIWKFFEHRSKVKEEALAFFLKSEKLCDDIWKKGTTGIKKKVFHKKTPFFHSPYKHAGYGYRASEL